MPAAETGQANTGLASPVVFGAGLLLLGLSPIIRGGNRHVALVLLEWLALLLLVALLARGLAFRDRADAQPSQPLASAGVWVLALSPLWVALVQLIPLPVSVWAALPGHAPYVEALAVAQAPAAAFRPLSLTPDITLVSVLAGLPLSAAFLLAFYSSFRQIGLLVHALVGLAVAQAVLGLLQMGPFPGLSFGSAIGGRAIGTFANPNHFASYIAMTLPLAILLLRPAMVSARGTMRGGPRGGRPMGALWGVALFLLLAAVLASGSRGGTVTCLVVTLLAVLLLPQRGGHRPERRHWGHGRHGRLAGVGGTGRRRGCAAGPLRGRQDGVPRGRPLGLCHQHLAGGAGLLAVWVGAGFLRLGFPGVSSARRACFHRACPQRLRRAAHGVRLAGRRAGHPGAGAHRLGKSPPWCAVPNARGWTLPG
jgi:hypothetical protein